MKRKVCFLLVLVLFVTAFPIMITAYADGYKTLELDDTCSIEIPAGSSYWKTSGGYKYYKYGQFILQISILNSTLNLSSEKNSYRSMGLEADYDYSYSSVRCVYGMEMDSKNYINALIGFNSKQHGIRLGVSFYAYSDAQSKYFLHIIDSIKVYDKGGSKVEPQAEEKSGWSKEGNFWRYYEKNVACTGWKQIDGKWYYFDPAGNMATGWLQGSNAWYYMNADGAMQTGWIEDGGDWYYMGADGAMRTGWVQSGNSWYLMKPGGAMATGWYSEGGKWYYFTNSGAMATGWQMISGSWYYFRSSGAMASGWQNIDGNWYYFRNSGIMATGWFEDREAEANLPADQKRALWYWFDNKGIMAKGWKEIDGQWEMFADNGEWLYTYNGN